MRLEPIAPKDLTSAQKALYLDMKNGITGHFIASKADREDVALIGPGGLRGNRGLERAADRRVIQRAGSSGKKAFGLAMNVTGEAEVEAGIDAVARHFGRIDILVSNAGIQIVGPLESFKLSDWKKLLSAHLDGAW